MIQIEKFFEPLLERNYNYYTGVPCSFFKSAINFAIADKRTDFYMASNEGAAVAMASGAYLAGQKAVVMMQNSGLGNAVSPLTSLNYIYNIPTLVLVSGRGFGVDDEPQHELMGRNLTQIIDAMDFKWEIIPEKEEKWPALIEKADKYMEAKKQPFIFIARKNCISDFPASKKDSNYTLKRTETIKWLAEKIHAVDVKSAIFATTGMIGRELYEEKDRKENFYMMGSMGHLTALALGFAHNKKDTKTFLFDGDGALIMHAGTLSTIGHYPPENFYHILLDNHIHGSTGNQSTTASTTNFCGWAKEAGYLKTFEVKTMDELENTFGEFTACKGPVFMRIYLNSFKKEKTPRITESYTAKDIAANFQKVYL